MISLHIPKRDNKIICFTYKKYRVKTILVFVVGEVFVIVITAYEIQTHRSMRQPMLKQKPLIV